MAELTTGDPIEELGLKDATLASLESNDIRTIADLLKRLNLGRLTNLRRIGGNREREIVRALQGVGFEIPGHGQDGNSARPARSAADERDEHG